MTRLLSGLVLAALALAAIVFLPLPALRVVALAVALLATRELLGIVHDSHRRTASVAAYAWVAIVCWSVSVAAPRADIVLLSMVAFLLADVLLIAGTLGAAWAGIVGGIYIGVPLGALVAVHQLGGRAAVLLLLATVVASDSAQYYSGRLFGRHLLAPAISPKKTVEGALGGVAFGTAVMVLAGARVFPSAGTADLMLAGLSIVVLGICGDLFESRLKRVAGVKDSAAVIPGHGGVLDRIDALLFATPAFYLVVRQLM